MKPRSLSGIAPSKQESTTYEPSLVCKLLILGCRLLIPDRLLAVRMKVANRMPPRGGESFSPVWGPRARASSYRVVVSGSKAPRLPQEMIPRC